MMTSWRNPQNRHTHPELGNGLFLFLLGGREKLFSYSLKKKCINGKKNIQKRLTENIFQMELLDF